jgi:hypothetical protein
LSFLIQVIACVFFKNGDSYVFKVTKFSELDEKIVPFFKDYPILGAKSKDFYD